MSFFHFIKKFRTNLQKPSYWLSRRTFSCPERRFIRNICKKAGFIPTVIAKVGIQLFFIKREIEKNMYFIVIFTSSPGKRRTRLKHSLDPRRKPVSFVHNNPTVSKRRDLGGKPLTRLKIHKEDKPLVKAIEKKNDS